MTKQEAIKHLASAIERLLKEDESFKNLNATLAALVVEEEQGRDAVGDFLLLLQWKTDLVGEALQLVVKRWVWSK